MWKYSNDLIELNITASKVKKVIFCFQECKKRNMSTVEILSQEKQEEVNEFLFENTKGPSCNFHYWIGLIDEIGKLKHVEDQQKL